MGMNDGDISINLRLDDKDFAVTVKNAGRLLSELRGNLNATAGNTQRVSDHFTSFATHLRHTVMTLASVRFALMDFNDVFLTLPKSILRTSGEVERLTKLMEGLSKETTEAGRKMEAASNTKFIFSMAKDAPFEVKSLADAFVKLKVGGLDPTNGSLKALVDSVARFGGDSEALHRASIAIQQMAGKGVISMEELRQQLGEAVPTAMNSMAVGMGVSMQTLVSYISKGVVESRSALTRMFAVMRAENDGAAASMMTTWTGTVERLKTTWELAKVEMGQGGLFDVAKDEVNKLIDSFEGNTMRSFMTDIAFVTGQAAQGFAELIEAVRKYYDEIKLAGEVFVAGFAATKIMNMGNAVFTPIVQAYRQGVAGMIAATEERNLAEEAAHANAIQRAKAREASLLEEKTVAQSTYAQMNAQYNAMVAERTALDREANKFKSAAYAELLRSQTAALEAEMAAVKANALEHRGRAAALEGEIAAQRAHIAALEGQTTATTQLTGASSALAGMRGVLGGLWTAIGGWVGVVTIALTAGVMAWMDYASAAERAAQRAKNAAKGISDAAALAAATQERDRLGEALVGHWNQKEYEGERKRWEELNEEIKQHRENLEKDRVDHAVAVVNRETAREIAGITSAWRATRDAKLKELDDDRRAIEEKYKGNAEGLKKAMADFDKKNEASAGKVTRETEIGRLSSIRTYMENQNERLREELTTASDDRKRVISELIDKNEKGIKEMSNLIKSADDIGTMGTLVDKKKEKTGKTPLEHWLDSVHQKLADINGELNKKGSGDVARLMERLSEIKDISPQQKDALRKKFEPLLISGEDELEFKRKAESMHDTLVKQIAGVDERLAGGSDHVAKLRFELEKLMKLPGANMDGIAPLLALLDDLEQKKSTLDFRDLSSEFTTSIESVKASMSDDGKESVFAQWAKDIETYRKKIEAAKLSGEDLNKAMDLMADYTKVRTERMKRDIESPLEKLGREWENVTKNMQNASTAWAERTLDVMMELATTGKANFREFALSVAKDMLRIQMKEAFGGAITGTWDTITKGMTGLMKGGDFSGFGSGGDSKDGKDGAQTGNTLSGVFSSLVDGGKKLWANLTGAGNAAENMAEQGDNVIAQTAQQLLQGATKMTAEQTQTFALQTLTTAATAAAQALYQVAGSSGASSSSGLFGGLLGSFFGGGGGEAAAGEVAADASAEEAAVTMIAANGGVMGSHAPMELKKFAKGGVARRPEFALFGEAGPEAFVPLPDGRSIPVTMKGAGGMGVGSIANVEININVVNENGSTSDSSDSKSSGGSAESEFYKNMATQIKGIVVEQIVVQQRPGGVLYGR